MLENDNKKEIPEVRFTFREEEKSEEERKKEIEELLKKRNKLYASMGIPIPSTTKHKTNKINNNSTGYTR